MRTYFTILYLVIPFCKVFGEDIFQGIFRQSKPCFKTVKTGCNGSLVESFMPENPNVVGLEPRTFVFLFTSKNPDVAEPLHECGGRLPPDTTYDVNADTEIFIHGWLDGVCRTAWMRECKEQLFERARHYNTSYNVILIDWTWGNTPDYIIAGLNSRIVGEQNQTATGPEKFHIIGHSFGAIAAGFAGRKVRGLRRITALDPAYAPFMNAPPEQRITYRDARIVDVIHSNGFDCFAIGFGDKRQLGHADFYPNGGTVQPNCISQIFESVFKGDLYYALGSLEPRLCSHLQSIQYYRLSINPKGCQYVGIASNSYEEFKNISSEIFSTDWAVMGMDYELYRKRDRKPQKYYLTTGDFCPYYDNSYLGSTEYPFETACVA